MKTEKFAGESPLEIERKYLIARPTEERLRALGFRPTEIAQTYLRPADPADTERVRAAAPEGETPVYTHTRKRRLSALVRREWEETVSRTDYEALLRRADGELRVVEKTRWKLPWGGLTLEVDVFPFWRRQALLEVELPSAETDPPLPGFLRVLREVTQDEGYTNRALAAHIPEEEAYV